MLFGLSMLRHPRTVGAVWPTSRRAVEDLLDMADLGAADVVVEFGAGTGVYTEGILRRLAPDARFLSYEVDGALAAAVARRLPDRRLEVVNASAENVLGHLGALGKKADVVVSSLPFSTLPAPVGQNLLDAAREALAPGGVFLVLQYSKTVLPELERRFPKIRRRLSPLNVPPAVLFSCEVS
ncbi:class I SAM-dependent methyltransferase [Rubrobacter tropicus]|nr:methyltransferase [Rubrobacter tropicus]